MAHALTVEGMLRRHPFAGGVAITTAKTVAADLLVQAYEAKPWDRRRTALFALFGSVYQGGVQYVIVNRVLEGLFPGARARAVLAKVCGMNFVADPLLFLPCFYVFKEGVHHAGAAAAPPPPPAAPPPSPGALAARALARYRENCVEDWRNSWCVWLPGHAVTYGLVPAHLRLPWISALSFGYVENPRRVAAVGDEAEPPPLPLSLFKVRRRALVHARRLPVRGVERRGAARRVVGRAAAVRLARRRCGGGRGRREAARAATAPPAPRRRRASPLLTLALFFFVHI